MRGVGDGGGGGACDIVAPPPAAGAEAGLGKFLRQLRVLAMRNRFKEKLNFKLHLELATPLGHSVVGAYG